MFPHYKRRGILAPVSPLPAPPVLHRVFLESIGDVFAQRCPVSRTTTAIDTFTHASYDALRKASRLDNEKLLLHPPEAVELSALLYTVHVSPELVQKGSRCLTA